MLYTDELKIKTAERLKALRTEKGLTFYALQKAINKRYETSTGENIITNTTLKYLETTDPNDKKNFKKSKGVKVETLLMLADFYGVSVQYLVGTSDIRAINDDMENAVKKTGLSEKAIEALYLPPIETTVEADTLDFAIAKMNHLKTSKVVNDILEKCPSLFWSIAPLLYVEDLSVPATDSMTVDGIEYGFPSIPELKFYGYMERVKGHIWHLRGKIKKKRKEK